MSRSGFQPSSAEWPVITGLGAVSSFGCGREALAAGLAAGEPRLTEVVRRANFHRSRGSRLACLADTSSVSDWVSSREARRASEPSRLTLAAARMALADASCETNGSAVGNAGAAGRRLVDPRLAVVMATTFGPPGITEELLEAIFSRGPAAASPFAFPESVANAPAAQVAIAIGAGGPNLTITQRNAGPLLALARAQRLLRSGQADRVLVGAFDEANPLLHAVLDRFRALATARPDLHERARPFARCRNGFVLGEGATVALLERPEAALARGARVLARLGPSVAAFDPSACAHTWGHDSDALAATLVSGLAHAGLALAGPSRADLDGQAIEGVVSGASGARQGDRREADVLAAVKERMGGAGWSMLAVPKAVVGEHGGGFLAATILAAAGCAMPSADIGPDDELGLRALIHEAPVSQSQAARRPCPSKAGRILATALAPGGAAAWQVLAGPS